MEDLTTYLTGQGARVFQASGHEVTTHCFFCPDGDPKGKGKLYINTESWLYDCKRCGEKGNRRTLLRHFGDEDTVEYLPGEDPGIRRKILEEATELAVQMLANNEKIMLYLLGRGLSAETIVRKRLGYVPSTFGLSDSLPTTYTRKDLEASGLISSGGREFYRGMITIPYFSRGQVVSIRAKDPDGKYFTASGDSVRLYNADVLADCIEVVITEGEFDGMVLEQQLALSLDPRFRRMGVVSLPGAASLPGGPEGFERYFSTQKRIFLGLDPDEVGKREAIKIKALLGSKARIVELPTDLPKCDWSEYINGRSRDVHDVTGLLTLADLAGKRVYSVADAASRWQQLEDEQPGIRLGFSEVDALLKPGIKPGNLVIPMAKTGAGKSVFLGNIAYYTRARYHLMISLEQTASEVYDVIRKVTRFHQPFHSHPQIAAEYPNLRIVDENRLTSEDLSLLLDEYAEEVGRYPELVSVDYLGYYARGIRGGSPYEKTSNAVMQLKAEAKRHELAIIAPHQVNRGAKDGKPLDADEARDSGVVEETADFMFGLYKPDEAVEGGVASNGGVTGNLRLGILKSRKGGKGRQFALRMSAASLVIVDETDRRAVMRIEQENAMINQGLSYEEIYRAQSNVQQTLRLA